MFAPLNLKILFNILSNQFDFAILMQRKGVHEKVLVVSAQVVEEQEFDI